MFFCFLLLGSLSAMRFVAAVQEKEKAGDKQVEQVSRELWRRIWSEDKDITEPASLAEVPTYPVWLHLKRFRRTIYLVLSQLPFFLSCRQQRKQVCLTVKLKTCWSCPPQRRSKTSWKIQQRKLLILGSVVLQFSWIQERETRHYSITHKISPNASFQAFGFPMMVCHVDGKLEMFFGSDRFELMAHCIGKDTIVLCIIHKHIWCKSDKIKIKMM